MIRPDNWTGSEVHNGREEGEKEDKRERERVRKGGEGGTDYMIADGDSHSRNSYHTFQCSSWQDSVSSLSS